MKEKKKKERNMSGNKGFVHRYVQICCATAIQFTLGFGAVNTVATIRELLLLLAICSRVP
jgi:hypothetical protein